MAQEPPLSAGRAGETHPGLAGHGKVFNPNPLAPLPESLLGTHCASCSWATARRLWWRPRSIAASWRAASGPSRSIVSLLRRLCGDGTSAEGEGGILTDGSASREIGTPSPAALKGGSGGEQRERAGSEAGKGRAPSGRPALSRERWSGARPALGNCGRAGGGASVTQGGKEGSPSLPGGRTLLCGRFLSI